MGSFPALIVSHFPFAETKYEIFCSFVEYADDLEGEGVCNAKTAGSKLKVR